MPVITTWNLENFFRPGGEYGPRTQDVYEKKLAYLADRIHALAPDVVAVREVGDPHALTDLAGRLPGTWRTALSNHPDRRDIRVRLPRRTPVATVAEVTALPAPLLPVQAAPRPLAGADSPCHHLNTSHRSTAALAAASSRATAEIQTPAICQLVARGRGCSSMVLLHSAQ
jgi:hypothetical protein